MRNEVYILGTGSVFGGGEIFQIRLATLLQHQIRLVVVSPYMQALEIGLSKSRAHFVRLPAHGWVALRWSLLRWLWHQRIAIRAAKARIVLNGRGAAYWAPIVYMLHGVPPVVIAHTALSMSAGDIKELLYGVAARFARCVVTVSETLAEQHARRWPELAVRAIPNWMDAVDGAATVRQQDFLPLAGVLRIALVARLVAGKGVEDVVEAFAEMPDIELHVYGDGSKRDLIQQIGKPFPWLHFHGHVDDLLQRLPEHSILVSGSYSESFSYAVAEGIQAGLLCVLTDIPAHRELLGEDYPDDLFFPPGNQVALKQAMQTARVLLVDGGGLEARRVVAAAMARIAKRNSPELARQRYLAVLSDAGVDCSAQ